MPSKTSNGWSKYSLCQFLSFIQKELKAEEHACPLPILHDRIDCYVFSFFLPILSCQLPICLQWWKNAFFHFILCQNLHLLDREHTISLLQNSFSIQKLLPDFQGKSSQIAIFGSDLLWVVTTTHLSHEPYFQGFFFLFLFFSQFCDIKELAIVSL
jgi:hypothetical protein